MKRKSVLKIFAITLSSILLAGSLTGCGLGGMVAKKVGNKIKDEIQSAVAAESEESRSSEESEEESSDVVAVESSSQEVEPEVEEEASEQPEESTEQAGSESDSDLAAFERAALRNGYAGMLTTISMQGRLPENEGNYDEDYDYEYFYNLLAEYGQYDYETNDMSAFNHYSIVDVDGDGVEELLVSIDGRNVSIADSCVIIYQYDVEKNDFEREGIAEIWAYFTDDGYMISPDSHNHTMGDLWPYSVYQYDAPTDKYYYMGSAASWNKEYSDTDYEGAKFPDEIDVDGDGIVYCVYDEINNYTYVDNEEYAAWEKKYYSGNKIEFDMQPLIFDNYSVYTTEYQTLCYQKGLLKQPKDLKLDLGRLMVGADDISDYNVYYEYDGQEYSYVDIELAMTTELEAFSLEKTFATGEDEYEDTMKFINQDGDVIASYTFMDGGYLALKKQMDGLYAFGVQPGMTVEEAVEGLLAYHAAEVTYFDFEDENGNTYRYFQIGSNANYTEIALTINKKGKVTTVGVFQGCSFAG